MDRNIDELIASVSKEYGKIDHEKKTFNPQEKIKIHKEKKDKTKQSEKKESHSRLSQPVKKEKSTMRKISSFIFNLLFYCFLLLMISASILFALNSNNKKDFFGFRIYTIRTNSMLTDKSVYQDGFSAEDIIIVKKVPYSQIKEKDIVTFIPGEESEAYVTHRVVEKLSESPNGTPGEYIRTRGDANSTDDPPIPYDYVVGKKIFAIAGVGKVLEFARDNLIVCLVFIFSLFGFIFALKFYFAKEEFD